MNHGYKIIEPTFNTDTQDVASELDAIKVALAVSIFSQPHEQAISILKSLEAIENPYMKKLYKELMQFSPVNAK